MLARKFQAEKGGKRKKEKRRKKVEERNVVDVEII